MIETSHLFWMLKSISWAFLILSVIRFELVSKYPFVFVFIFYMMGTEILMPLAASWLGVTSMAYAYLYVAVSFAPTILSAVVIFKIYRILGDFHFYRDWHLIAVPVLLVVFGFYDSRSIWIYFKILNLSYASLVYLGLATVIRMRRNDEIDLGWNLKMVLLALTVPAGLRSLAFMVYTMGYPLSYEEMTLWLKGATLASWIVLAVGMSEYSPPGPAVAVGGRRWEGSTGDLKTPKSAEESMEANTDVVRPGILLWLRGGRVGHLALGVDHQTTPRKNRSRAG